MSYSPLTDLGKNFITKVCTDSKTGGAKLLSGKKAYPFPFSGPPQIDKIWTCNIIHNGKAVVSGSDLANALIDWFDKYAQMYQLDANVIAAQAYAESQYVMWAYPGSSDASGVNQFTMLTTFGVIVRNDYNTDKMTPDEIAKITNGLTESSYKDSYSVTIKPAAPNTQTVAYVNRPILHQNVIDNPEVMIKAQCRYMKYFANLCDSLASTSLFCYSRGTTFISNTYSKAIQKCQQKHQNDQKYIDEGINYVLKIFGVLGDMNNTIPIKNYKPSGIYFGYDDKMGKDDPKNLKINKSQYQFDAFAANVSESDEFGLQNDFQNDSVVEYLSTHSNKYKFIYFSEAFYNRQQTNKKQIVLHHTASGPGPGNDILWWEQQVKNTGNKVSVSFVVTRDGTILQLFSTKYWAYHLGISKELLVEYGTAGIGNEQLNSQSIGIEIDNWGGLVNSGGYWYPPVNGSTTTPNTNTQPITNVVTYGAPLYPQGYHGFFGFEKYTNEQIASVKTIIQAIVTANTIKLGYVNDIYPGANMWGTDAVLGVWKAEKDAYNNISFPGIWSHVSYVPSKSDCQPQQELVDMLKSLA